MAKKRAASGKQRKTAKRKGGKKSPCKSPKTVVAKRGKGRPKAGESPITPEVLQEIGGWHLEGQTEREIAAKLGVDHKTVHKQIREILQPIWEAKIAATVGEHLAGVRHLKREAFRNYRTPGGDDSKRDWLEFIRKLLDDFAKITGLYAAAKLDLGGSTEFRVAGKTPEQVDLEMMALLLEKVGQRRELAVILRALQG